MATPASNTSILLTHQQACLPGTEAHIGSAEVRGQRRNYIVEYELDASDEMNLLYTFIELGHTITLLLRDEGDGEEDSYHAAAISAKCSAINEIAKRIAGVEEN